MIIKCIYRWYQYCYFSSYVWEKFFKSKKQDKFACIIGVLNQMAMHVHIYWIRLCGFAGCVLIKKCKYVVNLYIVLQLFIPSEGKQQFLQSCLATYFCNMCRLNIGYLAFFSSVANNIISSYFKKDVNTNHWSSSDIVWEAVILEDSSVHCKCNV